LTPRNTLGRETQLLRTLRPGAAGLERRLNLVLSGVPRPVVWLEGINDFQPERRTPGPRIWKRNEGYIRRAAFRARFAPGGAQSIGATLVPLSRRSASSTRIGSVPKKIRSAKRLKRIHSPASGGPSRGSRRLVAKTTLRPAEPGPRRLAPRVFPCPRTAPSAGLEISWQYPNRAGLFLAMGFMGRPNVKFFGAKDAAYKAPAYKVDIFQTHDAC